MKNSPMYQHEAIGLTISNGVPKFGQLLNAAWDHTIICRFKLLPMSTLSYNKIASGGASNSSSTGTEGLLSSSEVKEKVCSSSLGSGSGSTKKASGVRRQQRNARFEHLSDTGSAGNSRKRMAPKKDEE
ncbi:E3 ubiquitin-protein ligase hyd [Culex quinquefasciatus]|uniref:E3 ubiquitin-protein ligase hyd n=1 Tax=Culex quinquefasciatus TaxID=7176 RepID=UPI0018E37B02|nr:E3 ubiquitin-protein ligase hyd [Culex quinquefasciatus]